MEKETAQTVLTPSLLENQTVGQLPEDWIVNIKNIVITRDFGQKLILDVELENSTGISALDALKNGADVETAYGGGFVNGINGVRSEYSGTGGSQEDWFFYVNGVMANVGSGGYMLREGDVEHWDYHNWNYYPPTATVGFFPEPFLHGYNGKVCETVVLYEDGLAEDAELVKGILTRSGVKDISILRVDELTEDVRSTSNLIVLGTMNSTMISELNELRDKLGFYVYFEEDRMVILNAEGEVARNCTSGGVIQATQSPWNPKGSRACENVVWMVAGVDEEGVKSAVKLLTEKYDELQYAFAVAVVDGQVCRVPIC